MKIKFLGTSHGYPEKDSFCSATLIRIGNRAYVIDAGAPITQMLLSNDVRLEDVQGIFVTHPHTDHSIGLIEYIYTVNLHVKTARTNIYLPTPFVFEGWVSLRKILGMFLGNAKIHIYKNRGVIFDDGTVKITAVPVKHCPHAHSFIFEAEGKKIFFSGDLKPKMTDYPQELYNNHFDLLVLEAAHTIMDTPEVLSKVNKSKISRLFINHISPSRNPKSVLNAMFSKVNGDVECKITHDGFEYEL